MYFILSNLILCNSAEKTVRNFHHFTNNKQCETRGVSINPSFSNFKHPSDSSFGGAMLVLCMWVSKHHWYLFYLPQIQCLVLETSLQTANNWSWCFISTICLHFYSVVTAATFSMFSVSTETHLSVFNPCINYNKLHICYTLNYLVKLWLLTSCWTSHSYKTWECISRGQKTCQ